MSPYPPYAADPVTWEAYFGDVRYPSNYPFNFLNDPEKGKVIRMDPSLAGDWSFLYSSLNEKANQTAAKKPPASDAAKKVEKLEKRFERIERMLEKLIKNSKTR